MNKHGEALLAEIVKDPGADAPRAVLADHLEQEGELDRANFIRAQLRRASLPRWDAQAVGLELHERALLAKHEAAWRAQLPTLNGVQWGAFSRGFVGKVRFDNLGALAEHRTQVRRAIPLQRIVMPWPRGKAPKVDAIDTLDELSMVGAVMGQEELKWLAGCPLVSTIRALDLIGSALRTGLPHLLKSAHLGKLEALRIRYHHLGNSGLAKLVAAKTLPALAELDLCVGEDEQLGSGRHYSSPAITSKGILELAAWSGLAKVHTLDVSGAKLGAEGLLMLLASPHTKALETLRIRNIKDGDWDMDDSLGAFKSGPAGTLAELDISGNDIDPEAALFMAEAKSLRELKVLRLDGVRSAAFDRLAKASWIRSLRVVSCSEAPLPHLLKRTPEQLHTLQITASSAPLSKVVQHLAANPPPSLLALDLRSCRIDDAGLRALGDLQLPKLLSITLPHGRSDVSRAALTALAGSPLGAQLTSFDCGVAELDRLPAPPVPNLGDEHDDP